MKEANELRDLIYKRIGLEKPNQLSCPREKSQMTPCVARDGSLAAEDNKCIGCGFDVIELLNKEKTYHNL